MARDLTPWRFFPVGPLPHGAAHALDVIELALRTDPDAVFVLRALLADLRAANPTGPQFSSQGWRPPRRPVKKPRRPVRRPLEGELRRVRADGWVTASGGRAPDRRIR